METQAFKDMDNKDSVIKELNKRNNDIKIELLCTIIGLGLLTIKPSIYIGILTMVAISFVTYETVLLITLKKELNRIKKYELLIDNDLFLNKKEKVIGNDKHIDKYNVNTINKYSLNDLIKLRNETLAQYGIKAPTKKKVLTYKRER